MILEGFEQGRVGMRRSANLFGVALLHVFQSIFSVCIFPLSQLFSELSKITVFYLLKNQIIKGNSP